VGWGQEGEMTQALYAHVNNKTIKIKKILKKEKKIIIYKGPYVTFSAHISQYFYNSLLNRILTFLKNNRIKSRRQ
jgi:hypothetical protein